MSIIVYLATMDHWAIPEDHSIDAVPWIGRLLLGDDEKGQVVGGLAAGSSLLLNSNGGEENELAALLLANTISKLLDSRKACTLENALLLAATHISASSWPLFSAGIIRALRNREASVRKRAWIAASKLQRFDEHFMERLMEAWEPLVMKEASVEVLTAMCSFFEGVNVDNYRSLVIEWLLHTQAALVTRPFPALQSRILRLSRQFQCLDFDKLQNANWHAFPPSVIQEIVLSLPKDLPADAPILQRLVKHTKRQLKDNEHHWLIMARSLAALAPKSILHFQSELLMALESDDIQVRILALHVLLYAANPENWKILLTSVKSIFALAAPHETEAIIQALKIGREFIAMHADGKFEEFMSLLDLLPESIGEQYVDRLYELVDPTWSTHILTRDYLFGQQHSSIHELISVKIIALSLEPALASRLLEEFTLKHESWANEDFWFRHFISRAHSSVMNRGYSVTEKMQNLFASWVKKEWDTEMRALLKRLVNDRKSVDDLSELVERFKSEFEMRPPATRDDRGDHEKTDAVEHQPAIEAAIVDTMPFPDSIRASSPSPLSSPATLTITSDLFKGLL